MMIEGLYYPVLKRQLIEKYYKKGKTEFYANYNCSHNYDNVALDCQYRCVYCDVHIDECGGEKFSLDHFRPKKIFGKKFDGILNTHPFNLYLSCQKCNALKLDDWKGCEKTQDGKTYLLKRGYLDRFQVNASDFFDINEIGQIVSINNEGPGDYMIGRLHLNRVNRVYLRKLREVKIKMDRIRQLLVERNKEIADNLSGQEGSEAVKNLLSLNTRFLEIVNL